MATDTLLWDPLMDENEYGILVCRERFTGDAQIQPLMVNINGLEDVNLTAVCFENNEP